MKTDDTEVDRSGSGENGGTSSSASGSVMEDAQSYVDDQDNAVSNDDLNDTAVQNLTVSGDIPPGSSETAVPDDNGPHELKEPSIAQEAVNSGKDDNGVSAGQISMQNNDHAREDVLHSRPAEDRSKVAGSTTSSIRNERESHNEEGDSSPSRVTSPPSSTKEFDSGSISSTAATSQSAPISLRRGPFSWLRSGNSNLASTKNNQATDNSVLVSQAQHTKQLSQTHNGSLVNGQESVIKQFETLRNSDDGGSSIDWGSFVLDYLRANYEDTWSEVVNNYTDFVKSSPDTVSLAFRAGVPAQLREVVWQSVLSSKNEELEATYHEMLKQKSPHEKAIRRDVGRTFSRNMLRSVEEKKGKDL